MFQLTQAAYGTKAACDAEDMGEDEIRLVYEASLAAVAYRDAIRAIERNEDGSGLDRATSFVIEAIEHLLDALPLGMSRQQLDELRTVRDRLGWIRP